VHALVPDAYVQCTHQFQTRMLGACIVPDMYAAHCSAYASVPDVHAQSKNRFLTCLLSVGIRN
jgi:hypothetical protein